MPVPQIEDATRVRYLRSNQRSRAVEVIQVWRSDTTGREFEIRESRSYAPSDELERGAEGYLDFTGGSPAVTRRPLERSERLGRYQQWRRTTKAETFSRPNRGNIGGWLLLGALLLVILWALL